MINLRRFFTENLGLKIISLILAVSLWLFVVGEETSEIGLSIPVEIINVPPDLAVTNDVIDDINLRVSGPRRMIRRLASETLSKIIDLQDTRAGIINFDISPEDLPLPHGVKVTRLSPTTVTLQLEKIEQKKVNILPVLQGSPAPGYEVVSVRFIPDKVTVSGPTSVLASLDTLWTKPISVEKKSESFKQEVTLDMSLHQVTALNKEPIQVEVTIDQRIVSRSYDSIPIKAINTPYVVELNPKQASVMVMGPVKLLSSLEKDKDIEAYVDLQGLPPGEHTKKISIRTSPGLSGLETVPSVVQVNILNKQKGE
jgi:YbbR domain-containing protein